MRWSEASGARLAHALGLCVALASSFIVAGGAMAAAGVGEADLEAATPPAFLVVLGMALFRSGLVVGLGLLRGGGVHLGQLGWRTERLGRSLALGLAGGVAAIGLTVGFALVMGTPWEDVVKQVSGYSLAQRLLFAFIGLEAAFSEETLFRGYLQPTLVARLGMPLGLGMMAVVFAGYHLNPRLVPLAAKLALGLLFGLLRGRERPLFIPATAHGLVWLVLGVL